MKTFILKFKNFTSDEQGVTAIEYGLIAGLIGIAIATVAGEVGQSLKNIFIAIAAALV